MNYEIHLKIAVQAAQQAGALLHAEFNRAGGPRGAEGKCPADVEAERVIRDALAPAFPGYGFIGEEIPTENRPPRAPDHHLWLIDPNDGTRAYQRGWRGAAVSIALLRAGVPVLGVVFAYAARAGFGDLFAWAEGQAFTRNGARLEVRHPTILDESCTIFVSQGADENPAANARLCAPARFRAVPSIAYRLALAAAGEGVAGVSLNVPTNYDFAGGHALLRATGGELFTLNGNPVQYDDHGNAPAGHCIGGVASLARELADRDWLSALAPPDPPRVDLFAVPASPVRTEIYADRSRLNRAQGCMLGQIAGDNLGALVESQNRASIAAVYPSGPTKLTDGGHWQIAAGQPTDDSELALMLGRSILEAGGYDAQSAARAYEHWYESAPFDVGNTIGGALQAGSCAKAQSKELAVAMRQQAASNTDSQANGALMRIAPLAIFGHALPHEQLASMARSDAALTHAHQVCQDANAVFAVSVAFAIKSGATPAEIYRFALDWATDHACDEVVDAVQSAANAGADECPPTGWVLVALQNAYYQLLNADSAEQGIIESVRAGGDTDTTAAIAGALLGATYGLNAMPAQWLDRVLCCRPMQKSELSCHPRPQEFWPVDALLLAERLVCLGQR